MFEKKYSWNYLPIQEAAATVAKDLNINIVIAKTMLNRGITSKEGMHSFLYPSLTDLHNPHLLKDMDKGVELVASALDSANFRIIGDYDVDGVMSTYILYTGLKKCGANVDYDIPRRVEDGYGLNPSMVRRAYDDGVDFIITCDNGIAAAESISLAKELGMTVVVTDHHQVPFTLSGSGEKIQQLPIADAVIDPHQDGCQYPYKNICGAVVALKFICALYEKVGKTFADAYEDFIEFAAFATDCDIMPLCDENRSIMFMGLQAAEKTKNVGLRALILAAGLHGKLYAHNFGFILGPCINATGRLEDAKISVELLTEKDEQKCIEMAGHLVSLNEERKKITNKGQEYAVKMVEEAIEATGRCDDVIVLYMPWVHESVAGLIASKVKERFYRPTIILTDSEDEKIIKGSARSIEAYNLYEELCKVEDIFTKFGGHPMAAGMSLPKEKFQELHDRLNENSRLKDEDFYEPLNLEGKMALSFVSNELVDTLSTIEPYGVGNPRPMFGAAAKVVGFATMGSPEAHHCKLFVMDKKGRVLACVAFGQSVEVKQFLIDEFGQEAFDKLAYNSSGRPSDFYVEMELAFTLDINEFRGSRTPQLQLKGYKK